jgi:hypothetical protein
MSGFEESKSCRHEVGIEGECGRHVPTPHHEKADVIHETHLAFARSLQLTNTGGVSIVVDPFDSVRSGTLTSSFWWIPSRRMNQDAAGGGIRKVFFT